MLSPKAEMQEDVQDQHLRVNLPNAVMGQGPEPQAPVPQAPVPHAAVARMVAGSAGSGADGLAEEADFARAASPAGGEDAEMGEADTGPHAVGNPPERVASPDIMQGISRRWWRNMAWQHQRADSACPTLVYHAAPNASHRVSVWLGGADAALDVEWLKQIGVPYIRVYDAYYI